MASLHFRRASVTTTSTGSVDHNFNPDPDPDEQQSSSPSPLTAPSMILVPSNLQMLMFIRKPFEQPSIIRL